MKTALGRCTSLSCWANRIAFNWLSWKSFLGVWSGNGKNGEKTNKTLKEMWNCSDLSYRSHKGFCFTSGNVINIQHKNVIIWAGFLFWNSRFHFLMLDIHPRTIGKSWKQLLPQMDLLVAGNAGVAASEPLVLGPATEWAPPQSERKHVADMLFSMFTTIFAVGTDVQPAITAFWIRPWVKNGAVARSRMAFDFEQQIKSTFRIFLKMNQLHVPVLILAASGPRGSHSSPNHIARKILWLAWQEDEAAENSIIAKKRMTKVRVTPSRTD